jgi:hypothetical protein
MKRSILFIVSFYILLIVLTAVYAIASKNHFNDDENVDSFYEIQDSIINSPIRHVILFNRTSGDAAQVQIETDSISNRATLINYSGRNHVQVSGDTLLYYLEVGEGSLYLKNKLESITATDIGLYIENDVLDESRCSIELVNSDDRYNYRSNEIQYSHSASFREVNILLKNTELNIRSSFEHPGKIENLNLNLTSSGFNMICSDSNKNNLDVGSLTLRTDSLSQINVPASCLMNLKVQ